MICEVLRARFYDNQHSVGWTAFRGVHQILDNEQRLAQHNLNNSVLNLPASVRASVGTDDSGRDRGVGGV